MSVQFVEWVDAGRGRLAEEASAVPRDYYADSNEIAERLIAQGHDDWAVQIRSAIESGFTSTEILMGLRWQLGNLIGADLGLDEDTLALAEGLHADINDALR